MPKQTILLIEDIDCAFPSREESDEDPLSSLVHYPVMPPTYVAQMHGPRRSAVTLSGLLNVIDGVGSEEGKLFFATVRSTSFLCNNSDIDTFHSDELH